MPTVAHYFWRCVLDAWLLHLLVGMLLGVGCFMAVVCCVLLEVCALLFVLCCELFASCSLFDVCCLMCVVGCSLFVVCYVWWCLLYVGCGLLILASCLALGVR